MIFKYPAEMDFGDLGCENSSAVDEEIYKEIERRYGFRLPSDYRSMQELGWFDFDPTTDRDVAFDPGSPHGYLWLNDMEWLSLAEIRDHQFPNYCLSGFVPFAFTGGGDHWCWYPKFTDADSGSTPVVLCPRDSNTGEFYAPHFLGAMYRQALDYAQTWRQADEVDLARAHLAGWASRLGPFFPRLWQEAIAYASAAPLHEWKQGKITARALLRAEECAAFVKRDLSFPQLDGEFKWMED